MRRTECLESERTQMLQYGELWRQTQLKYRKLTSNNTSDSLLDFFSCYQCSHGRGSGAVASYHHKPHPDIQNKKAAGHSVFCMPSLASLDRPHILLFAHKYQGRLPPSWLRFTSP